MKILLIEVGKTKESWLTEGIDKYHKRIMHYCDFDIFTINDRNKGKIEPELCKKTEGEQVLSKIKDNDYVCLLDERGSYFSSIELSEWFNKRLQQTSKSIVFVIGGAYGFSQSVYDRANAQLSLSKMTFSHQIIRLIFAEQLYRVFTILNHEPYHHE